MVNCRYPQRRPRTPWLAAIALASTLFACAQIAGVEAPDLDPRSSRPEPRAEGTDEPETGAIGEAEKNNTDSNAEGIEVTPPVLDFGTVVCRESKVVNLVVVNKTERPRPYEVVMPPDAPFTSDFPLKGWIAPRDHITVPIVALPTVSGDAKANIIVTSEASFATVPAGVIGAGATLEWMTSIADIGETPLNTEGTTRVRLRNTGVRAATITGFAGVTPDFVAAPAPLSIAAGADDEVELKLTKGGAATGKLNATLQPIAAGLCAPAPALDVTGQRVNTTVTVSGADWGKKDCDTTPSDTRDVVVRNYSNREVAWTLMAPPTSFDLQGPMSGVAPPSSNGTTPGTANIRFKSQALSANPGLVTETIAVMLAPNGGTPTTESVTLRVDVRGAVIKISPTELSFVAKKNASSPTKAFTITNTGNETASLAWSFLRTAGGPAWVGNPQSTSTGAQKTTSVGLSYRPSTDPPNTAELTPTRSGGGKICNAGGLAKVKMTGNDR
ncbi:MAG: hypothetical protein KF795_07100 [Labilithrix sp.]|nr:hypothetical protein [Labilithrix sp.]